MIALASQRPVHMPVDDALAVAVEHAAWRIREGDIPGDVFAAIAEPAPLNATWTDAIWALAKAADRLGWLDFNDGEIVEVWPAPSRGRRAA